MLASKHRLFCSKRSVLGYPALEAELFSKLEPTVAVANMQPALQILSKMCIQIMIGSLCVMFLIYKG